MLWRNGAIPESDQSQKVRPGEAMNECVFVYLGLVTMIVGREKEGRLGFTTKTTRFRKMRGEGRGPCNIT